MRPPESARTLPSAPVRVRSRILAASAASLVAVAALVGPLATAAGAEEITRERVDLTVTRNGTLHVVETIDYDFGPVPHHGIIRAVVVRTRWDDRNDRVYPISNVRVNGSQGTPIEVRESNEGALHNIKIGDPDRTITGLHRYVISYDVEGAMTRYRDHDELYWNTLGSQWTVTRSNVNVTVHMPARITRVTCFSGPVQSNLACDRAG